jgi:hypothetical protein
MERKSSLRFKETEPRDRRGCPLSMGERKTYARTGFFRILTQTIPPRNVSRACSIAEVSARLASACVTLYDWRARASEIAEGVKGSASALCDRRPRRFSWSQREPTSLFTIRPKPPGVPRGAVCSRQREDRTSSLAARRSSKASRTSGRPKSCSSARSIRA